MSDVRLRLALEKSLVASLTETRGSIHDEFGIRHERDAAVAGEVETMRRLPLDWRVLGADLQMNQVVFAVVMPSHRGERFPIDTFFVNAQSAPGRFVLKNLVGKLIDAGTGLAGAGVPRDEPAATKLVAPPCKTPKSGNTTSVSARREQKPGGDKRQQNATTDEENLRASQSEDEIRQWHYGIERDEKGRHGQALPMR